MEVLPVQAMECVLHVSIGGKLNHTGGGGRGRGGSVKVCREGSRLPAIFLLSLNIRCGLVCV